MYKNTFIFNNLFLTLIKIKCIIGEMCKLLVTVNSNNSLMKEDVRWLGIPDRISLI